MNSKSLEQAKTLVKAAYITQGEQALNGRRKLVTSLLSNRSLPERGWDDVQIEFLLQELALMDSNNFVGNVGVGEREGRVYCSLVARRNYNFSHGVGRSGDVAEVQPKAAGSSLLAKLCHALAGDALRIAGLSNARASLVLPMATGMSLALTLSALRVERPGASCVVWTRMDQKSCFKAIVAAGFTPVVVANVLEGDSVVTDVTGVGATVERCGGAKNVLCVVTTTSCFAPRLPDKVDEVARVCASAGIGHVINNAYGVQCSRTCRLINRAMVVGRVDAVVQSTDKNFMVPVGGAIVCGPNPGFIEQVGKSYAGRASAAPCLDLFITLLSMGKEGWKRLLSDREEMVESFRNCLQCLAARNGERLLDSGSNTISFAITLDTLSKPKPEQEERGGDETDAAGASSLARGAAFLGSMLFTRCVSGTRVVPRGQAKTVAGVNFAGYGASIAEYPHDYLTAACAVGLSRAELEEFSARLEKAIVKAKGSENVRPLREPHGAGATTTSMVNAAAASGSAAATAAGGSVASGNLDSSAGAVPASGRGCAGSANGVVCVSSSQASGVVRTTAGSGLVAGNENARANRGIDGGSGDGVVTDGASSVAVVENGGEKTLTEMYGAADVDWDNVD